MSKEYNNKRNQNLSGSVLEFPNKLNTISIFLLVVIYGVLLGLIYSYIYPKYNYVVPLNYESGSYNDEINPHIFIRGTAKHISEEDDTLRVDYRVFAYIKQTGSVKPTNVRYAYSGLDKAGFMDYFYESSKNGSNVPVSHYVVASSRYPGGEGYEKFFIKARYKMPVGVDEYVTKELELSEEVIELTQLDLVDPKFSNTSSIDDLITVSFKFIDSGVTSTTYKTNMKIEFEDLTVPYHVNVQTWLVTEDNQIYPYLGLYNYSTRENFNPYYDTPVNKYVNPEFLYMKLDYTNEEGNITNIYYKISIEDLLEANNS